MTNEEVRNDAEKLVCLALTQTLNRRDPVVEPRMSGEKASPFVAGYPANPGEGVDHNLFGIARAAQYIDSMRVGAEFFFAPVTARHQFAGNGRHRAGDGRQLLQARAQEH